MNIDISVQLRIATKHFLLKETSTLILEYTYLYFKKTGEKRFKCNFQGCNRVFITLGNLNSHKIIHTDERPFNCSFEGCNKRYSRIGRLEIHERTHVIFNKVRKGKNLIFVL